MGTKQNISNISSKYLETARAAVRHTRKVLDIGASNKIAPWDFYGKFTKALCAGTGISKGALQERIDQEMAGIPGATYKEYVDVMASWARQFGCGNCGPHSAVAFVYLRDEAKTFPLDWMMYNNFQHAFVIVGRRSDTVAEDFTTWNRDAAICDPWRGPGEAELVFPYANLRFKGKKLELLYRIEDRTT
jgi:hypothetical protein